MAGSASDSALSISDFYSRCKRCTPGDVSRRGLGHRRDSQGDHVSRASLPGARQTVSTGRTGRLPTARKQLAAVYFAALTPRWRSRAGLGTGPVVHHELEAVGVELTPGLVVRVRGTVTVWEGASKLRFSMTALDVEALVGGIAAARRRLLGTLASEDLLEANRRLRMPLVPLRIGLVTSPGSEAYLDFTGQLERSGYLFDVRFEPSLVQGPEAPAQIVGALARLEAFEPQLVVVVQAAVRGDLAAFDSAAGPPGRLLVRRSPSGPASGIPVTARLPTRSRTGRS